MCQVVFKLPYSEHNQVQVFPAVWPVKTATWGHQRAQQNLTWMGCSSLTGSQNTWTCCSKLLATCADGHSNTLEDGGNIPGLLSVGGESRSLIWASLSPSTHWTSRVLSSGQLAVQRADTATQEQPERSSIRRPAGTTVRG